MARLAKATMAVLLLAMQSSATEAIHIYTGDLGPTHVLLAWGTARGRGNTIGRDSISHGKAQLRVGDKVVETTKAWAVADGLEPDRSYDYELTIDGRTAGKGRIRTWPAKAASCSFLVFGDFGNGSGDQRKIAEAMARVVKERAATERPIRFILSTGDNIYSVIPGIWLAGSGDRDADWVPRFFAPYKEMLGSIPMYPILGNHDGNESEKRGDLDVYLDNFFFPGNRPARWYTFNFGGLIDFFALDTTRNTERGPKAPVWLAGGEQHKWAERALRGSRAPWKLAYMHHPIFNAGPGHDEEKNYERMKHFLDLFGETGVQAVFQGHEHNLQISRSNERGHGIRFFVTGAGGELRRGDVRAKMESNNIEAWAAQRHFLIVDAGPDRLTVTAAGDEEIRPVRADGAAYTLPVTVERVRDNKKPDTRGK
ncbi:MAG: metallophosphoesterase [Bryobacteraceae bacterium]|nr:metallophosphoesterase [Bryobacteraceae bacterium]